MTFTTNLESQMQPKTQIRRALEQIQPLPGQLEGGVSIHPPDKVGHAAKDQGNAKPRDRIGGNGPTGPTPDAAIHQVMQVQLVRCQR